jgi:hypothetical protein
MSASPANALAAAKSTASTIPIPNSDLFFFIIAIFKFFIYLRNVRAGRRAGAPDRETSRDGGSPSRADFIFSSP